jgi:hypothetical protein
VELTVAVNVTGCPTKAVEGEEVNVVVVEALVTT